MKQLLAWIGGALLLVPLQGIALPDLSPASPGEQAQIAAVCKRAGNDTASADYGKCLQRKLSELESVGGEPDLTLVPADAQAQLRQTCENDWHRNGPGAYYACLTLGLPQVAPQLTAPADEPPAEMASLAQEALAILGYDPGAVDGVLGPRTAAAVKQFQHDIGVPQSGHVDMLLMSQISAALRFHFGLAPGEGPGSMAGGEEYAMAPVAPPEHPAGPAFIMPAQPPENQAGQRLTAAEIFAEVANSVFVVLAARTPAAFDTLEDLSQGSAVAIAPSILLTACHVVAGRPHILVGDEMGGMTAWVVAEDPLHDRCILQVESATLEPVPGVRDFAEVEVGETVYTVGNPAGLERTLGQGLVSGLRDGEGVRLVQTTALISPGSSGGGLFDERGNLVGITTFQHAEYAGLNFAIAAQDYWHNDNALVAR